jgi:ribosomal protein S18 acetylase RimI-like enzyme
MGEILKDLSAPALVAAIKANLFAWYRYLGRSPKAELFDSAQLTWVRTGISNSFVNCVLRTQLKPEHVDATIEETLAHFKNVAAISWWTEPGTQPTDLGEYLLAHGLAYTEGGPGMAVDLRALNEDLPTPPNLTVERVDDAEALEKWAYASIVGFELPDAEISIWFDVFAGLGFDLPLRNYVGFLDGEPVATSQLFLAAGVAGIYVVATVPEARRRGIGAALTLAPLRQARAMGYRIGILHSSPLGLGVYQQLGFREQCRMSHYVWAREAGQQWEGRSRVPLIRDLPGRVPSRGMHDRS